MPSVASCGTANLTPEDIVMFKAAGVWEAMLKVAQVRRVTHDEARDLCGIRYTSSHLEGVAFPYLEPGDDRIVTWRVRRDHPEVETDGTPIAKYTSPPDRKHLYFVPGCHPQLADTTAPAIIVESEKAVLAIASAEITLPDRPRPLVIGTGGCWGWRGVVGKATSLNGARVDEKGPLGDFDRVAWTRRDAIIAFDANAATNTKVQAALRALATVLKKRGAKVRIAELPVEPGINGPDDYIGRHGAEAFFALVDDARPARRAQDLSIADLLAEHDLTSDAVRDATLDVLEGRLRDLSLVLNGADRLRRALVAESLKKEVKIPAAVVTAALATSEDTRPTSDASTITLTDDEPWSEPTDGAVLLDETAAIIKRHVVMSQAQADAVALWAVTAHASDSLTRMAMLCFSSPSPECGKTTAATVMYGLVPRPIMVAQLTPAVLFRLIHTYHPTLIADEVDSWLTDEKSELRGVFNAAHWRSGAVIPRCVGDDHHIELFNVFGPKVLAMIGRPPATMLSRCIVIVLRRKTAGEHVGPLRDEDVRDQFGSLRQRWRRWVLDRQDALREHQPVMPAGLPVNRAADNWRPLLSVADLAGGDWPARASTAALELSGVRSADDEPENIKLLTDVQVVFQASGETSLSSAEVITGLKELPERAWADWNKGRGITPAQLASRLRDFGSGLVGLRTRETRIGARTGKRWHQDDFVDAWSRYAAVDPQHPQQSNDSGPEPEISSPQHGANVAGLRMAVQPMGPGVVAGVAGPESDPAPCEDVPHHDDRQDEDHADDGARY